MPTQNFDSNVSQIVLQKFAKQFESDCVLMNTVDRQLIQGELNPKTGDTVFLKRPTQYSSIRTANGDLSGLTKSPIVSGKIPATISEYCTVAIEFAQVQQALEMNQLEELLRPISARINTDIETELAKFIHVNGALQLGDLGKAITQWGDVAQCGSMLKDLGVVGGENYAVMNPWAAQNLANAQAGLHTGDNLVRSAWEDAQISGNFAGVRALMSNGLASRTSGTGAGAAGVTVKTTPSATYDDYKDTMTMAVTLTGFTAGQTLIPGDVVQFETTYWVNQQTKGTLSNNTGAIKYTGVVITGGTATAGGDITVTISGAAVYQTGVNSAYNTVSGAITAGDAVSILGAAGTEYKPNLFYNSSAIAMGTVELPKLHALDSSVMSSEKGGLSIRVHKYSDGDKNQQMMRFDVLPAFSMLNPFMAGGFSGV